MLDDPPTSNTSGALVRYARMLRGIALADLAIGIGTSVTTLQGLEDGTLTFLPEYQEFLLTRIAAALNVSRASLTPPPTWTAADLAVLRAALVALGSDWLVAQCGTPARARALAAKLALPWPLP